MNRRVAVSLLLSLGVVVGSVVVGGAAGCAGASHGEEGEADARSVLRARCAPCHSPSGEEGEALDVTSQPEARAHARKIAARIRSGAMPPPPARLSPEERAILLAWADSIP